MQYVSSLAKGGTLGLVGVACVTAGYYIGYDRPTRGQVGSGRKSPGDVEATPIRETDVAKRLVTRDSFATGHTNFAFGSEARYYLATRTDPNHEYGMEYRSFMSKYAVITQLLNTQGIRPYYVGLTPHDDQLITYKDLNTGKLGWAWHLNVDRHAQAPNYVSLQRWFGENAPTDEASMLKTFVVFGPGASVFARTADSCFWQDLPRALELALQDKKREYAETDASGVDSGRWIPRVMALGAQSSYVAVWEDGALSCSLPPQSTLLQYFKGKSMLPPSVWENIVLSPHSPTHYFSATKLGHVDWNTASDGSHGLAFDILRQADAYMQLRAKEDNRIFTLRQLANNKTVDVVITPETDWNETSLRHAFSEGPLTPWLRRLPSW